MIKKGKVRRRYGDKGGNRGGRRENNKVVKEKEVNKER